MSYIVQVTLYRFLFFEVTGRGECCFAVRLNTPEPPRWEEPPAVCCRLPGYLPSSLEVRLRLRIHHRGPPPVTHDVSRLTRRPRPAAPSYAYRNSSTTVTHPSSSILLLYLHGINYPCRAFARRSCHTDISCIMSLHIFSQATSVTDLAIYPIMEGSIPNNNLRGVCTILNSSSIYGDIPCLSWKNSTLTFVKETKVVNNVVRWDIP